VFIQPTPASTGSQERLSLPSPDAPATANGELAHSARAEQRVVWRARAVLKAQLPSKAPYIYGVQPQPVLWAAAGELPPAGALAATVAGLAPTSHVGTNAYLLRVIFVQCTVCLKLSSSCDYWFSACFVWVTAAA
jgi:hypothetical protein